MEGFSFFAILKMVTLQSIRPIFMTSSPKILQILTIARVPHVLPLQIPGQYAADINRLQDDIVNNTKIKLYF